jgi:peptide/nickel transport system permease protein
MGSFIARRLGQSLIVLAVMSLVVFVGVYAIGNPVDILISPQADQAEVERTIASLGLDRPIWEQYARFVQKALTGDLGTSFVHSVSAIGLIVERLPATLELAAMSTLIALVLGVPLGLWAGAKPDAVSSQTIMAASLVGFSLPTFWIGLMLILVFSVQLGWFPTSGRGQTVDVFGVPLSLLTLDGWRHIVLPATTLALFNLATVTRLVRSGTQEAMQQEYVRFAQAKGLSTTRIIGIHILKNIVLPVITVTALQFGTVLAFAIVTETIFVWPGMGKLLMDSISNLDRPVIVAYLLVIVALFVIINLLVDIVYSIIDPRVRLGGAST